MRTSGLGPLKALGTLVLLGLGFVVLTFVFGDYVAPAANRAAATLQARFVGDITVGRTGAWMKDRQGERSYSVNVGALSSDGTMNQIRIFEFDPAGARLLATVQAAHNQLSADFDTLRKQLEQQPANHTARPASTGGNPAAKLAAY